MAGELWGWTSGRRLAVDDDARLKLLAAQTQNLQANTRHQDALIGLNQAQADVMRRKMADEESRSKALRDALALPAEGQPGAATPGAGDAGDALGQHSAKLIRVANAMLAAGEIESAGKLIDNAREIFSAQSTAAANAALEDRRKTETHLKALKRAAQLMSGVTNPASHAAAVAQWQADTALSAILPISKTPLAQYDPAAIRAFIAGTDAEKQKLELALKERDLARKISHDKVTEGISATRAAYDKRRTEIAEEREARLAKAGEARTAAKETAWKGRETRAYVKDELKRRGIKLTTGEADSLAYDVTEEALRQTRANPALKIQDVVRGQLEREISQGNLDVGEKHSIFPGKDEKFSLLPDKPPAYTRPGDRAEPLPKTPDGLKPGGVYRDSKGNLARWDGKAWTKIASTPITSNPLADDEDEEDMDE